MGWGQVLAEELSKNKGETVQWETLFEQFKKFRAKCENQGLRESYPEMADGKKWGDSTDPREAYDFILSFLDEHYPNIKLSIADNIAAKLRKEGRKKKWAVNDGNYLEHIRRRELVRREKFWKREIKHIRDKYCGLYFLVRRNSAGNTTVEPVFLHLKDRNIPYISIIWAQEEKTGPQIWWGELIVNQSKFSGTIIRKSTDRIPEPVSLAILRTGRHAPDNLLLLSGILTGWKNYHEKELSQQFFALFRSEAAFGSEIFAVRDSDVVHFEELSKSKEVADIAAKIDKEKLKESTFLKRNNASLHNSDAEELMPEIRGFFPSS